MRKPWQHAITQLSWTRLWLPISVSIQFELTIFNTNSHQSVLLGLLMLFVAFFSLSQGSAIWVYIGEVFPTAVRSEGQGVGSASHWIVNTIIALGFPVLVHRFSEETPFAFFAAATVVQLIVVTWFYPETKGQTLEQLQRRLIR